MRKTYRNVCYRCGKERIVLRVWKEKVGNSVVRNTENVCPDKKCQEVVEKDIKRQRNKRLQIENKRKETLRNRSKKVKNKSVRG